MIDFISLLQPFYLTNLLLVIEHIDLLLANGFTNFFVKNLHTTFTINTQYYMC
jgi:hypothetical protein